MGNDTLRGDNGNDVYVYSEGDGNDFLDDNGTTASEVDTLKLIDIASTDVNLRQSGNDLMIDILATSETIQVDDRFVSAGSARGIELIEFSDGVRVEVLDNPVAESVIDGTSGSDTLTGWGFSDRISGGADNDTLVGNEGDDVLIGGAGNDHLNGDDGSDLYIWSVGDGNDFINENGADLGSESPVSVEGADTLLLEGVNVDAVSFWRANGTDDLQISIGGETIFVDSQFENAVGGDGIEFVEFGDGTVWSLSDIFANTRVDGDNNANALVGMDQSHRDNLYGAGGSDTLTGNSGDDVLDGGTEVDTLIGGDGNDTYVWRRGDGADFIDDNGGTGTFFDTLLFEDVLSDAVDLERNSGDLDLWITVNGVDGAVLQIDDQFTGPIGRFGH